MKDAAPEPRFVGAGKHPSKASMLGAIMSDGKALLPFSYEGSMDGAKYKKYLQRQALPMLDTTHGKDRYVFTQDGAPVHRSNNVQVYLEGHWGSRGFWSREMWPPLSPNLNPMDFSAWMFVRLPSIHTKSFSKADKVLEQGTYLTDIGQC